MQRALPSHTTTLIAPLVIALFGACGSVAHQPEAANRPLVVPSGGNTYLLFASDMVEEHEGQTTTATPAVPSGAGSPAAVGFDLDSGEYGAVAYGKKYARVRLGEREITWRDAPWSNAPGSIAVKGALAIALSGHSAYFMDLAQLTVEPARDVGRWFDENALGTPLFACPLSPTRFALVGADGAKPRVQLVDRSGGSWSSIDKKEVADIQRIHTCSSDGRALYLAGVREVEMRSLGSPRVGDLRQTLIVSRMDLDEKKGYVIRPIVKRERQAIESVVTQVAAGPNLLLVALDDGELMAFKLASDGASATEPVFQKRYGQRVVAVWLDETTIAVEGLTDHVVRLETIAAR